MSNKQKDGGKNIPPISELRGKIHSSKEFSEKTGIPRKFIEQYALEHGNSSRGKQHDWNALVPEIVAAYLVKIKDNPPKEKNFYLILNKKHSKKEDGITYLGCFDPSLEDLLKEYVRKHNYLSDKYKNQLDTYLNFISDYCKTHPGNEDKEELIEHIYSLIAKQECLINDFEILSAKRSRPRKNILTNEELENCAKSDNIFPPKNVAETSKIIKIRKENNWIVEDENILIGKKFLRGSEKDGYLKAGPSFDHYSLKKAFENYSKIAQNQSQLYKTRNSAKLFTEFLNIKISALNQTLENVIPEYNKIADNKISRAEELNKQFQQLRAEYILIMGEPSKTDENAEKKGKIQEIEEKIELQFMNSDISNLKKLLDRHSELKKEAVNYKEEEKLEHSIELYKEWINKREEKIRNLVHETDDATKIQKKIDKLSTEKMRKTLDDKENKLREIKLGDKNNNFSNSDEIDKEILAIDNQIMFIKSKLPKDYLFKEVSRLRKVAELNKQIENLLIDLYDAESLEKMLIESYQFS